MTLDPETQVVSTIGAKEGLAHLLWVLAAAGDNVVVPTPAYPIHRVAPRLAGATVVDCTCGGRHRRDRGGGRDVAGPGS